MRAERRDPASLNGTAVSFDVRAEHLYVHVPFCARRCVYCDFSIAVRSRVPVGDYLESLAAEWDVRHADSELDLETLYLGGGTPSKLGGEGIARLMDLLGGRVRIKPDAEITLEANPEDVTTDAARGWHAAGINRVSLGVQSFDDAVLSWMHRTHDTRRALDAIEVLRDVGLSNISIDLIFATPPHVHRDWRRDIDKAISLDLPHVSVYGLTVEPHTPLGRWIARSDVTEATEDIFEREYLLASAQLRAAGFDHYEVSNYGRPRFHSRHNWAYWRRAPYVGLGPSAHEFDGTSRQWNLSAYTDWVRRVGEGADTSAGTERLDEEQIHAEQVYLGLRTMAGTTIDDQEAVTRFVDAGWAELSDDSTLRLTTPGYLRLDSIASSLTLLRSR